MPDILIWVEYTGIHNQLSNAYPQPIYVWQCLNPPHFHRWQISKNFFDTHFHSLLFDFEACVYRTALIIHQAIDTHFDHIKWEYELIPILCTFVWFWRVLVSKTDLIMQYAILQISVTELVIPFLVNIILLFSGQVQHTHC